MSYQMFPSKVLSVILLALILVGNNFHHFFFILSGLSFTDTDNSQDSRGREGTFLYSTLPIQSHSHLPENPISKYLCGRSILLTHTVIASQVKWCATPLALCIQDIATRSLHFSYQADTKHLSVFFTHFKPVLLLQKYTLSDLHHPKEYFGQYLKNVSCI